MDNYKENKVRRSERQHYRSLIYITIALIVTVTYLFKAQDANQRLLLELDGNDTKSCGQRLQEKYNCTKNRCEEKASMFNYLYFYQCGIFKHNLPFSFCLLLLLTVIVLRLLSSTADEFFCICLETLVVKYKISPNTAGVTFLSFGNGSTDVFALIVAFLRGSYEMGVGGNIGASLFITTIVVSLVLLTGGTIHLNIKPFLRDILFLLTSVVYLMIIFIDGKIRVWESIVMLSIYVIFVILVITLGDMNFKRKEKESSLRDKQSSSLNASLLLETGKAENDSFNKAMNETSISSKATTNGGEGENKGNGENGGAELNRKSSSIDLSDIDDNIENLIDVLEHSVSTDSEHHDYLPPDSGTAISSFVLAKRITRDRSISDTIAARSTLLDQQQRQQIERRRIMTVMPNNNNINPLSRELYTIPEKTVWRHVFTTEEGRPRNSSLTSATILNPINEPRDFLDLLAEDVITMHTSGLWILFKIIEFPILLLRQITIPLIEEDIYTKDTTLMCCVFMPLFTGWVIHGTEQWYFLFIYLAVGIILAIALYKQLPKEEPPENMIVCTIMICMAFVSSVLWIYLLANELVNLLQTMGMILELGDTIMGLTVMALGNSIGDFVADVAVAKQGYPSMAIAGTFCSPLFQLIFGLGAGFLIQTIRNGTVDLVSDMTDVSLTQLFITFFFLIGGLLTSLISAIIFKATLPKYHGGVLLILYIVYILFIILLATDIFTFKIRF